MTDMIEWTAKIPEYRPCPICGETLAPIIPDTGAIYKFFCSKHGEFAPIALLIPTKLRDFLIDIVKCMDSNIYCYLEYCLIASVESDLEAASDSPLFTEKAVVKNYGLTELFK